MKKTISVLMVLALAASFAQVGEARNAGDKLQTGVVNIFTSPYEILDSVQKDRTGKGFAAGKSHGLLEGLGRSFTKLIAGIIEVGTFPLPWPNEYKPILDDTEGFKVKK